MSYYMYKVYKFVLRQKKYNIIYMFLTIFKYYAQRYQY